jgi:hypothetical protein
VKPDPLTVTRVPVGPLVGANSLIVGACASGPGATTRMSMASFVSPGTRFESPDSMATSPPSPVIAGLPAPG